MSVKKRWPITALRCLILVSSLRSVLADHVRDLLATHWFAAVANVNGALVGGASLKAADFLGIALIYR